MLLHVDSTKYKIKPGKSDIGRMKVTFTKAATVKDLTVQQIAAKLTAGQTIQPGVTPYSEATKAQGKTGTADADFARQTIFLNDIDNKIPDTPIETPAHVAEFLATHNLKAAFMYETFNSTAEHQRFRFALVSDEEFTDKAERDNLQEAIIAAFPQSDPICTNADRMFFGTDKGLIDEYTDFEAVCRKADLLAFAEKYKPTEEESSKTTDGKLRFGDTIPTGQRHGTLVKFASTVLTKYGICDTAHDVFMQRVSQCEEPKPEAEIQKIWKDACKHYTAKIETNPDYIPPAEYAVKEFEQEQAEDTPKKKRKIPLSYHSEIARCYIAEHKYIVGVQKLTKGGWGNDNVYEYAGGVWKARSESDVKSVLTKRLMKIGIMPDPKEVNKAYHLILMSGIRKDVDTFNSNENLVCFQNAVYRLSDGATLEHSPDYYFTTQLNANIPETMQETPYCDMCLSNFGGKDIQRLLLQVFGAGISNVFIPKFKKAVLQYGKGDTGKTQLKGLAERIVGVGNYNNVDLSDLELNRFLPAAFQNVRIGGSNDMSNVRVKELKLFKQLTGGDHIQAENKGEKGFTFRYKGLLWFLANQLPLFGGDKGDHIYNRWILIPCTNPVPPERQIKDLQDRMFAERDSFCIKALRAFSEAVANNYTFDIPESCRQANDEYKRKNSVVRTFLDECCIPFKPDDTKANVTTGKFWNAFKQWCKDGNYYLPGKAEFRKELALIAEVDENDLDRHTKDGNFYPYTLTPEASRELCPYDIPPLS